MKPRTAGIVLILAMILPFLAVIAFLQYQKMAVKQNVERQISSGIEKSNIKVLLFTHKETETLLKWKHSREFEYLGQMYDIVEQVTKGDTMIYYCWHDTKETRVNKRLASILKQPKGESPWKSETQKRINHFFNSLYFCENLGNSPAISQIKLVEYPYTFNYKIITIPPPVPPPKIG